jgi:peroxiredoxin
MEGMFPCKFPVTTTKPEAQAFINQGVAQLHGFWYFESERSFRQAAAIDPDCAIAYWGMAMSNQYNGNRAKGFMAEAVKRKDKAGDREKLYIDALAAFHNANDGNDKGKARRQAYIDALENIIDNYPDDLEAKAFLAYYLWEWRSQVPITSYRAIDAIIQQVLDKEPLHPVHHYRIHLWNYRKDQNAIDSAARAGQGSPGIAHLWHMPGHIFDRLGRFNDAAWQQEASARVDHAFMMRDHVLPDQIHNYAHNNEWLVRTLSTIGRGRDAVSLAMNMCELPRHPKYNTLSNEGSATLGRRRLFDALERFEMWDDVITCTAGEYLAPRDENEEVRNLRLRGVALINKGDTDSTDRIFTELARRYADKLAAREKAGDDAADKARAEKKDDKAIALARDNARKPLNEWVQRIESAMAELRGQIALRNKQNDDALRYFELAKDTPRPRLIQAYLAAGNAAKAEEMARSQASRKTDTVAQAILADVLFKTGKKKEAIDVFNQLRPISMDVDLAVPAFARLKPIAQELKLPDDWRAPRELAKDLIPRPTLDSLGPFRWQPTPAEPWKLTDADGKSLALADFAGKPVIVIFYLGAGCVHCTEQLAAFVPMTKEFAQAGISIIAISSDDVSKLKESNKPGPNGEPFAFPIVSNGDLSIFKAYRAFDDFENRPLHGTFLVDGSGLIRWQDVNFAPFMDTKFLLGESKRLLALPAKNDRHVSK